MGVSAAAAAAEHYAPVKDQLGVDRLLHINRQQDFYVLRS